MDKIVIVVHGYFISFVDRINWCYIFFFLFIEWIDYIVVTYVVNNFWLTLMRLNFLTYIFFIHYFVIDADTWLRVRYFLKINECIKWTSVLNVDVRKVWSSYNSITVWCIQITGFTTVDVWVNISTSIILYKCTESLFLVSFLTM